AEFTIESLGDGIHNLLKKLDALPCVLCGLSMGGYVALGFSKKYPTDLKALVLVDTKAAGDTTEAKENRNKMIEMCGQSGARAVAEAMMPKMLSPHTLTSEQETVTRLRQIIESQSPRAIQNALAAMRDR